MTEEDYYSILQVPATATGDELKASYRKLVLQFHPDKQQNQANSEHNEAMFLRIQTAWKILSDVESRKEYNGRLHQIKMSKINAEEVSLDEFVDSGEEGVQIRYCRCGEGFEVTK